MVNKSLPPIPDPSPYWFNPNAHCAFREGFLGHNIDVYFVLKAKVQELVRNSILTFKDLGPNVKEITFQNMEVQPSMQWKKTLVFI